MRSAIALLIFLIQHATGLRHVAPRMRAWRSSRGSDDAYGGHAHDAFVGDVESVNKDSDIVFAVLDKDGDGSVSKSELVSHLTSAGYDAAEVERWFEMDLDSNKDGVLSKQELRDAFQANPELQTAPGLGTNLGGETPQAIRMDATNFIFEADTAREGFITAPEMQAHLSKVGFAPDAISHVFTQIDLDADETLSRDEIEEVFLKYSALRLALRKVE